MKITGTLGTFEIFKFLFYHLFIAIFFLSFYCEKMNFPVINLNIKKGKGIATLSMDEKYLQERNSAARKKPKHAGEGLMMGICLLSFLSPSLRFLFFLYIP
jgi:hypothetical protein